MKKYITITLSIVLFLSVSVTGIHKAAALLSPSYTGYFTGDYRPVTLGSVFNNCSGPAPFNSSMAGSSAAKNIFIDQVMSYYTNGSVPGGCSDSYNIARNKIGAQFIIQTMRGVQGNIAPHPSTADINDWKARINNPNITISWEVATWTDNSGYYQSGTSTPDDFFIGGDPGSSTALVFRDGLNTVYKLKYTCGNPVGSLPGIPPPPPIITGSKVDTTGSPNGIYASDTISATTIVPGTPSSDTRNPYSLQVQEGTASVIAANNITGWNLVGYDTFTCVNTATSPPTDCGKTPQYTAITVPHGTSYTYTLNTNVKNGYVYTINWVYQPPPPLNPVTIMGNKVDTKGNSDPALAGDPIRVTTSAGPAFDTNDPFNITNLPTGSINVTPDSVPGWTVVGYTVCVTSSTTCTRPSPLFPTPGNSYPISNATPGQKYNMYWVFSKNPCSGASCGGGVSIPCPNSGLADPSNVPVPLPEPLSSPAPSTALTTNSNLGPYNQYEPTGTKVTSVQDISNGGNHAIVPTLTSIPIQNPAVLNYSPYITAYTYDNSQPRVVYDSNYTVTPWTLKFDHNAYSCPNVAGSVLVSGPDATHKCTYSTTTGGIHNDAVGIASITTTYCTSGGTWNGSTTNPSCGTHQSSTPTSYTYSCPSGQTLSGSGSSSVCTTSYPAVDHWTCSNSTATWSNGKTCLSKYRIHHYVCPYGGNLVSTTCVVTYQATASPVYGQIAYPVSSTTTTTYTCPFPYTSGGGTTNICSYNDTKVTWSYPLADVTVWYKYVAGTQYKTTVSNMADGALMNACYPRGFNVTAVNATSANVNLNNNENPTLATAGGYTASIRFYYPDVRPTQGLRQPMKVNLSYSYRFNTGCTGGGSFTATGGFSDSGPSPYPITAGAGCGVSVPPLQPGDTVCVTYNVSPSGSTMAIAGNVLSSNGSWVPSGPACSGHVVNEPYFKVFGGDISSGNTFATTFNSGATSCVSNPANASAGTYGWNTAADPVYSQHYAGSGAQFAVTSPNVILGVASNQNNINANPSTGSPNPLGLSFSNTVNNSAPTGQFGGKLTANCITDFYSSKPATDTVDISGSQNLNGLDGKKTYTMSGGSIIKQSNITPGKHITIYATGNIFIEGDITFTGNYPTIDQIPSLILIVKGNIYISNNVKNLYGIYIAQPTTSSSGADGYIYDCAASAGIVVSNNSIYNTCGNQLVVNGSFIANKVALMRTGINAPGSPTGSSLRGSSTAETNSSPNPAEIFNYGPAFWMNLSLPQSTSTGTSSAGYDSIISLPPIL